MRYFLGLVACLALSGFAKTDVVINSSAQSGNAWVSASGDGYKYTFTTGDASQANSTTGNFWGLTSLKLFGTNNYNNGNWTVSLLNSTGGSIASQNFTSATSNGSGETTFSFSGSMASTLLNSTTQYSIQAVYTGGATSGFAEINLIDSNSVVFDSSQPVAARFSNYSQATVGSAAAVGQFQLNASAVPEPGTLLLGGIAAACGGTGVWWKRRKRQPQAETTEQPAAI